MLASLSWPQYVKGTITETPKIHIIDILESKPSGDL